MKNPILSAILLMSPLLTRSPASAQAPATRDLVVLEAEKPSSQRGSRGRDAKAGASGGEVLGEEFGAALGDFAQYDFRVPAALAPARLDLRYARETRGATLLDVVLDGAKIGVFRCDSSGGWGNSEGEFRRVGVNLPALAAGAHRLRLTLVDPATEAEKKMPLPAVPILDLVGKRTDKNSVGHGKNVAFYTGAPSRFFYATHELGDVFSAAGGTTLNWFPDYVALSPRDSRGNINLDRIEIGAAPELLAPELSAPGDASDGLIEVRQVCVTKDDVVVSRLRFQNPTGQTVTRRVEINGDCRGSKDYRGGIGGEKISRREGNGVVMLDKNVFPAALPEGLAMAVEGSAAPVSVEVSTPGAYRLSYEVSVPAGGESQLLLACAIERSAATARANLKRVLSQPDPIAANRRDWQQFYERDIPRFESSDAKLDELYAFRWFLLKFSTVGGDLGLFKYPVVLEGRQEFQNYCCYSAPFMAYDMNWVSDPDVGFGQIANMVEVAYEDGRFPWYTTPRTNQVPLDHISKTGASLLPDAAWRWYQIHGDKAKLRALYPTMKQNSAWWIESRDPDGNGLFSIEHQLETGMDDLFRRWKSGNATAKNQVRYEAVDATTYAVLNLRAVSKMARELGASADAQYFANYARKSEQALQNLTWNKDVGRFLDRNPVTGELSDYNSICTFYPLLTGEMQPEQRAEVRRTLLNPREYWTNHPLPAMSQSDPEFDPMNRYWAGPSWPAATSHVIEGLAVSAKKLDRSLLPEAAELFRRAASNHTEPRPDFYERYDPFTGRGLSNFRDYMHSWWIDIYARHIAGMEPQDDGSLIIDPLPMKLDFYAFRNAPFRGHRLDVLWNSPTQPDAATRGLTVRIDGKVAQRQPNFRPGTDVMKLPAALFPALLGR